MKLNPFVLMWFVHRFHFITLNGLYFALSDYLSLTLNCNDRREMMQAVPPMDIYAPCGYISLKRLDLKLAPHFFTQTLKIKLSLDAHVHVKTIYIRHTDRR